MSKSIVKYAENACEYKTMELLSIELTTPMLKQKSHHPLSPAYIKII